MQPPTRLFTRITAGAAPPARIDDIVDRIHGTAVADPYRWLEDADSPETRAWMDAQNVRTRNALNAYPGRPILRDHLVRLLRAPTTLAPRLRGEWVFSLERGGDHDQAVLVLRSATDPGASARTLVDPAMRASDAAVAIDWFHPSPDGALVAYGSSEGGDERSTLRVLDVASGEHWPDVIAHTRTASVAWLPDSSAFAYTRYPEPASLRDPEADYHRTVWCHLLGTDPRTDKLVWGSDDMPSSTAWPTVSLSPDGRWLLIHVQLGPSRIDVHLVNRATGTHAVVIEGEEAVTEVEVVGDRLLGTTTLDAPRGRVITAPTSAPNKWETLVTESDAVIGGCVVAGGSLLVASTEAGAAHLHRYRIDNGRLDEVALPSVGTIVEMDADPGRERAFLTFASFARPPELLRWTPAGVQRWGSGDGLTPDSEVYSVEQVTYPSTDDVEVPLFLFRRTDTQFSPDTPAVLSGYGGFAFTNGPAWSPLSMLVADAGGIAAVAGIRGGGEHGEGWHRAGMGARKQQSFDDFIAAADWLVAEGMTSRSRLAIRGSSNGGLLAGVALTQRPDLCQAVHCAVPLADMVRFPRFLVARLWVGEYGDPDVAADFARLHAYSPYHGVADGTPYPAVLVTVGEQDSRVDPCHARKFVARLQAATSAEPERPVLLRVDLRAGHGMGKPVEMQADEAADIMAFLFDQLGVDVGDR